MAIPPWHRNLKRAHTLCAFLPSLGLLYGCNASWEPADGFGDGTVNRAPTITLSSPMGGDTLTTNQDLGITGAVIDDADVSELTLSLSSSLDGSLAPPTLNGDSFSGEVRLTEGEHTLTLTVVDAEQLSDEIAVIVIVSANQAPSAPAVSIAPAEPGTGEELVATLDTEASDPEGDALTYTWTWRVDGVDAGIDGDTVPASATADDQLWEVEVYADDGELSSEIAAASVIVNDGPTVEVSIDPLTPDVTDTLTCTWDATDEAGAVDASAAWYINGAAAGDASAPLSAGFSKDQKVVCEVNATADSGSTVRSASVIIINAAPVVEVVTLTPTSATEESTLSCASTVTDPDGDAVTATTTWFVGGTGVTEGASIDGIWFSKGDTVWCEVRGDDGEDTGLSERSVSIAIGNTAPTAPTIAMSEALLDPGDPVECLVIKDGTDIDGDTLSYEFRWTADGVTLSESGATFSDTASVAGRVLTCAARSDDGSDFSGWSASDSATVLTAFGGSYLANDAALTLAGTSTSGGFTKVSVPGDIDGDGSDDLLVGAYSSNGGDGAVYLFSSATLNGAVSLDDDDAAYAWSGTNDAQLGGGSALAGLPDVGGDGLPEIIAGGFTYNASAGDGAGVVYLLHSDDRGSWSSGGDMADDAAATIEGADGTDYCGIAVDGGDITGDGIPELFIGCYGDNLGANNAGVAAIFTDPGALSGGYDQLDADFLLTGEGSNDYLGWQGSHIVGDIDNDGYDDLFIGSYNMDGGDNNSGVVLLVSGDDLATGEADAAAFARLEGTDGDDRFGYAGAGVGDVDGDGIDDLMVGADKDDDGASDGGAVTLWYGGTGMSGTLGASAAALTWTGTGGSDYAGRFMVGGDLDGDGVGDALIGIPYDDDVASNGGAVALLSGAEHASWTGDLAADARAWIDGDGSNDFLGFGLALGDVSGDGLGDVIVGTLYGDDGASNGGTVHVFYGP